MTATLADVRSALSCENAAEETLHRFRIPAVAVLAAQRAAERDGFDVIGFYHSHPRGGGDPSSADVEGAAAGYVHLIVLADEVRAWRRAGPDSPFEEVSL